MVRKIRPGLRLFIILVFLAGGGGGLAPQAVQAQVETNVADPETIHIVQRGETLSSIGRRYGVTVAALMAYNNLTSTTIYVGQRLLIPGGGSTPGVYHTVQQGETLFSISRRYNVSVAAIRAANGLSSNTIYVGQRLLIPTGGGGEPAPGPTRITFAPGATSATVTGVASSAAPARYVVAAQGGQQMTVTLTADNPSLYIAVLHPNGDNLAGGSTVQQWSGTVPLTGDYNLEVRNPVTNTTNFSLTVRIQ